MVSNSGSVGRGKLFVLTGDAKTRSGRKNSSATQKKYCGSLVKKGEFLQVPRL